MVATRGRTFERPSRRSCHSSKLKSSSAPIGRKDSWRFHAVGSSNAPLLGSTAAEGSQRIGRTSTATRWRSCGLPQSASCSENFVIPPDVFGQTLRNERDFPHVVELALPLGPFRSVFLEIDAFHRERRIPVRRGRNRHEVKQVYIRFCFRGRPRRRPAAESASNSRRPMVTVIRPSRARCVKGTIPRHERAVLTTRAPAI